MPNNTIFFVRHADTKVDEHTLISKWKEKVEELQLNKIFYGFARETK